MTNISEYQIPDYQLVSVISGNMYRSSVENILKTFPNISETIMNGKHKSFIAGDTSIDLLKLQYNDHSRRIYNDLLSATFLT